MIILALKPKLTFTVLPLTYFETPYIFLDIKVNPGDYFSPNFKLKPTLTFTVLPLIYFETPYNLLTAGSPSPLRRPCPGPGTERTGDPI